MGELFSSLPREQQLTRVREEFLYKKESGWFNKEDVLIGRTEDEVIAALLDLEDAEIASIGDCMGGSPMIAPKLENFARK